MFNGLMPYMSRTYFMRNTSTGWCIGGPCIALQRMRYTHTIDQGAYFLNVRVQNIHYLQDGCNVKGADKFSKGGECGCQEERNIF